MGLVPISWLGDLTGVDTPVIDLIISVASLVKESDYRQNGRTARTLGLEGMDVRRILDFVTNGR